MREALNPHIFKSYDDELWFGSIFIHCTKDLAYNLANVETHGYTFTYLHRGLHTNTKAQGPTEPHNPYSAHAAEKTYRSPE